LSELDPSSVKAAYLAAIMNQRQFLSELPQEEGRFPRRFLLKRIFYPKLFMPIC